MKTEFFLSELKQLFAVRACRKEKCSLHSSGFNPIQNNRFQGSTLIHLFYLLGMLKRILRLHPGSVEKVLLSISDVCLGSTSEDRSPICNIFVICAIRPSLNIINFTELNYIEIVAHSKIKLFVFLEYCIFEVFKFCFCSMVKNIRHDRNLISLILKVFILHFPGYKHFLYT